MSREIIRIHPQRVISWNINADQPGMRARRVGADVGRGAVKAT
jgi:hypothetical protein